MSDKNDFSKFPVYLILIFIILSIGILTSGYLYYKNQEDYITKEKQQELAAIIALKIDQIISWRQERIDFASTIMDDHFLAIRVNDFIKSRTKPSSQKTNCRTVNYLGFIPISKSYVNRSTRKCAAIGADVGARTYSLYKIVGQPSNASPKSGFFRPIS